MSNRDPNLSNEINEDNPLFEAISEIEKEYDQKINEAIDNITEKYDVVVNEIKTRLENKYQEISQTLKMRHDLKERLKELKILLKTFEKEAKILTRNKQKELDDIIKVLNDERQNRVLQITGKPSDLKKDKEKEIQYNPSLY